MSILQLSFWAKFNLLLEKRDISRELWKFDMDIDKIID